MHIAGKIVKKEYPSIKLIVETAFQNSKAQRSLGRSLPRELGEAGVTVKFGFQLLEWSWGG